ncbi:MAG: hypothetical protein C4518_00215 [Desulfobacteraceae bacterium]|nr:MAG: hypothetical protein C4518_00215 [Desulfobacteraceae bacterium]
MISSPGIFVSNAEGSKYLLEIGKLGEFILLIKVSGYARVSEMKESIKFTDEYISKSFPVKKNIIVIEDYSNVEGADAEARKKYEDVQNSVSVN